MSEPSVTVRVPIEEIGGVDTQYPQPLILVESHWNTARQVVLHVQGLVITVDAERLAGACRLAQKPR